MFIVDGMLFVDLYSREKEQKVSQFFPPLEKVEPNLLQPYPPFIAIVERWSQKRKRGWLESRVRVLLHFFKSG